MMPTLDRSPATANTIIVGSYAAAVAFLTWATLTGRLGDYLYGWILMVVLAVPASLITLIFDAPLSHALIGERAHDMISAGDYAILALPGIIMTTLLTCGLTVRRLGTGARLAAWILALVVALSGIAITFDQWAPRRPFGWPLMLCGAGMAAGLLLSRRTRQETEQDEAK
jgi:uncharacterized membrane protein YhaH (DUF805 family)